MPRLMERSRDQDRNGSRLRKTAPGAFTIALALGIGLGTASCANNPAVEASTFRRQRQSGQQAENRQFEEAVIK